MSNEQLASDVGESRPDSRPPDDWRKFGTGPLRHTTPKERNHRNRGMASNTDGWRQNIREDRD